MAAHHPGCGCKNCETPFEPPPFRYRSGGYADYRLAYTKALRLGEPPPSPAEFQEVQP